MYGRSKGGGKREGGRRDGGREGEREMYIQYVWEGGREREIVDTLI